MSNERITEGIVRDHFKADPHFQSIKWDEQKTSNKRIAELLKGQSKGGGKGDGRPEFIISFPMNSNYLIVVECKADVAKHRSSAGSDAKDFAVDGVLHYAKALSKEFSVIAIAVSGESTGELLVSHFYWKKGAKEQTELPDEKLLAIGSYLQVFDDQFFLSDFYFRDIASKAHELNDTLYQYSIKELSRCTLVSAVLLALKDRHFVDTYAAKTTIQELGDAIITAIAATFKAEEDEDENDMVRNASFLIKEFQGILKEPLFTQLELPYDKGKKKESTLVIVKDLINELKTKVYPLVQHANVGYDVIGLFYTEFIRYAGSEQKLGLVLTPGHVMNLFCDLADLRENDIVYDPCCGTGGFIVAAIERLFKMVGNLSRRMKAEVKLGIIWTMRFLLMLAFLPAVAFGVIVGSLPVSEYADTEVSTNIPFAVSLETMSRIEFTLTFDASPTNAVEVSVGADENGDGRLSTTESAWTFGYDCGR